MRRLRRTKWPPELPPTCFVLSWSTPPRCAPGKGREAKAPGNFQSEKGELAAAKPSESVRVARHNQFICIRLRANLEYRSGNRKAPRRSVLVALSPRQSDDFAICSRNSRRS